ncbi:hypothetical protein Efla_003817 [Eimeria flavescens]
MPLESRLVEVYRQQVGAAAAADRERQLIDATKKRAIVSAGSYGEFKALVDGCHLRPLSREEMQSQPQRRLNLLAADAAGLRLSPSHPGSSSRGNSSSSGPEAQIRSQAQLRRQWESRMSNAEEQCDWLVKQPQDGLQRVLSVEIDAQLLLQVLQALAQHLATLAASRCCSCCCCCQTRCGAAAAAAAAAADSEPAAEDAFCCRVAYRVSLSAGFLCFLARLPGTAKGARLLLQHERQQLAARFQATLAALHAPVEAPPSQSPTPTAAAACCCKPAEADTLAAAAATAAEAAWKADCCQTTRAVRLLLQAQQQQGVRQGVSAFSPRRRLCPLFCCLSGSRQRQSLQRVVKGREGPTGSERQKKEADSRSLRRHEKNYGATAEGGPALSSKQGEAGRCKAHASG